MNGRATITIDELVKSQKVLYAMWVESISLKRRIMMKIESKFLRWVAGILLVFAVMAIAILAVIYLPQIDAIYARILGVIILLIAVIIVGAKIGETLFRPRD